MKYNCYTDRLLFSDRASLAAMLTNCIQEWYDINLLM